MADRIEQNLELLAVVETIDNGTYVGVLDSYACDNNNDESDDKEDDERRCICICMQREAYPRDESSGSASLHRPL